MSSEQLVVFEALCAIVLAWSVLAVGCVLHRLVVRKATRTVKTLSEEYDYMWMDREETV